MAALTTLGQAVDGVMTRLTALQLLAVADVKHAVAYPFHVQDSWPYWTNWLTGPTPLRGGRNVDAFDLDVEMRLVLGHLGTPYDDDFQAASAVSAADAVAYFVRCDRLADPQAADPVLHTPPRWLSPQGVTVQSVGLRYWPDPLDRPVLQVGVGFQLKTSLHVNIE